MHNNKHIITYEFMSTLTSHRTIITIYPYIHHRLFKSKQSQLQPNEIPMKSNYTGPNSDIFLNFPDISKLL